MQEISIEPQAPDGFAGLVDVVDQSRYERTLAEATAVLRHRTWWHVNSTAQGGGVSELLHAMLGYVAGAGIDVRWLVVDADAPFFEVTKRIHNRLHGVPGDGGTLGASERAAYDAVLAREGAAIGRLVRPGDVVALHDPQTAGLTGALVARGAQVVWVCHVGVDAPNDLARSAWSFLLGDVRRASASVFTRSAYVWDGLDPSTVAVIPPCIDAGSPKNVPIEHPTVEAVLAAAGVIESPAGDAIVRLADGSLRRVERRAAMTERRAVPATAPLVVQVSRWDRLKDPVGVLQGFVQGVPGELGAHLVLAGPQSDSISDDPEGTAVVEEVTAAWRALTPADRDRTHLANLPVGDLVENALIVNALQRRADVVVQKSLAEGFGLTVTEAMWKRRPVIGSDLGGIADQIEHGRSGLLVDPTDRAAFGAALVRLLRDQQLALELGHGARMRVRSKFLAPHFLTAHLRLAMRVSAP